MRIRLFNLLTYVACCFLLRCVGNTFNGKPIYEQKLSGKYYIDAPDQYEQMALSVEEGDVGFGVTGATIFAVGYNEDFIIAKQHPLTSPGIIDKKTTNYFIIPLKLKIAKSIDKNYYVPLGLREFEQKRKELKIDNLKFSIHFKDLE